MSCIMLISPSISAYDHCVQSFMFVCLLQELCQFGKYRELTKKIKSLISAARYVLTFLMLRPEQAGRNNDDVIKWKHFPRYCPFVRGADKKNQSSASLASVMGIHWWPVNSLHNGPVTRKISPFWRRHHDTHFWISINIWCFEHVHVTN